MKSLAALPWMLFVFLSSLSPVAGQTSPYQQLAQALAEPLSQPKLSVGVYAFTYEETGLFSPFSSALRSEIKRAMVQESRFEVFVRDNLEELEEERLIQKLLDYESRITRGGGEDLIDARVEAVVRGKFYYRTGQSAVSVQAELVRWEDSKVLSAAKVQVPTSSINVPIIPLNLEQSSENLADLKQTFLRDRRDFNLDLTVLGNKRHFHEGEEIAYQIRAAQDCHVALLVHQSDGVTWRLFPNPANQNTFVPAGRTIEIPGPSYGAGRFRFRITPPFGTDIVQAIACTDQSLFHQKISQTPVAALIGEKSDGFTQFDRSEE